MITPDKYLEILKDYEKQRDKNRLELEYRRNEIYRNFPEIKEIDDEISLNSIKLAKSALSLSKDKIKPFIINLKNENNILLEKKKNILLKNGYPESYLKEKFHCNNCQDTGYINNKKCKCFRQKIIDKNYNMYELKENLKSQNFEKFNFNLFSNDVYKDKPETPYENIKLIFRLVQNFIRDFDDKFENIVFYGDAGTGKTFLCNCIAKELIDKGNLVIYNTAPKLFKLMESLKFNKEDSYGEKTAIETLNELTEADLLIIDDLGAEFISIFSSSELFNIINTRILKNKSTIITTNLELDDLLKQYTSRITSRLYGYYSMIEVYGEDIRGSEIFKKQV